MESLPVPQSKSHILASTGRPAPIGVWIHDGRSWDSVPFIGPGIVQDYSTSWWLWWRSLQPTWRAATLTRDLRGTGDYKWDMLRKGTQNGFFVIILSLGLWLRGLHNDAEKGQWPCGDAMGEVEWVLDQMLTSSDSLAVRKRALSNSTSKAPQSKRSRKK